MRPLGIHPHVAPPALRQAKTVQQRGLTPRPAAEEPRRREENPLLRQADLFERPTDKFPARPEPTSKIPVRPEPTALLRAPAAEPRKQARRPEATMLIPAGELPRSAPPRSTEAARRAPEAQGTSGSALQRAGEGVRRGAAELGSRLAGAAAGALDNLELAAQLRRVANPSPLWTAAARGLGAAGDAMRSAASRWSRYAEGTEAAQRFAEGAGRLSLPRPGENAAASPQASSAADWRRASGAFQKSNEMVGALGLADDDKARRSAQDLLIILRDQARENPGDSDAHRALRQVADAASALGAAREPADAAQAARALRAAGKQVRQLFVERGGGAASVSTSQAATLQRLARVVSAGDEAADAFRRGSHRSLAAVGADLAATLAKGDGQQAAQALALRERTQELLAADAAGGADAVTAAKRLHVAIRQAQAGAQWERERLLQSLDRPARAA